MDFPGEADVIDRSILVGSIAPVVTLEQVSLFLADVTQLHSAQLAELVCLN